MLFTVKTPQNLYCLKMLQLLVYGNNYSGNNATVLLNSTTNAGAIGNRVTQPTQIQKTAP